MNEILTGAVVALSMTASLFFLRFWKTTGDRFFLYFALSFFLEGCNRLLLGSMRGQDETSPVYYLIRLLAYGLIIYAIYEKNRRRGKD